MYDEPCTLTANFSIEERKKAYLVVMLATNDIRL